MEETTYKTKITIKQESHLEVV